MKIISGRESADQPLNDTQLTKALGELYSAPANDSYWAGLEGRIMARVRQAEQQGEWWTVFMEWRAAGLVAAALMLTLAGSALYKDFQMDRNFRKLAAGAAAWTVFGEGDDDVTIAFSVPTAEPERSGSASRYLFTAEP
jgi:hypothetical protein